jgi:hypothetical protein
MAKFATALGGMGFAGRPNNPAALPGIAPDGFLKAEFTLGTKEGPRFSGGRVGGPGAGAGAEAGFLKKGILKERRRSKWAAG